jgi:methyl-accepting chemotaxis protein
MKTTFEAPASGINNVKVEMKVKSRSSNWNILLRMKLWQKFLLLGVVATVAVTLPTVSFYQTAQEKIEFTRTELSGIEPMQLTTKFLQLTQHHRGLSALVLSGNEASAQALTAKQAEIAQTVAALDKVVGRTDNAPLIQEWAKIKQAWGQIATEVNTRSVDARKNFDNHTALCATLLGLLESLGDYTKLTLDPYDHTYFLIQASLIHMPALTEELGQMRAFGAGRLATMARLRGAGDTSGSAMTSADRVRMESFIANASRISASANRFVEKAYASKPSLKPLLESELNATRAIVQQLIKLANKEVVESGALAFDGPTYVKLFTEGIDAQFKFTSTLTQATQYELTAQTVIDRNSQIVNMLIILAFATLAIAVAIFTVRNIMGTISSLQDSVEKVRHGDFTALQTIESGDEVGDLGRTVNDLLQERIEALRKAEAESESLNKSVISILQAVNQLSQKDLTARAPVTQDIIGTVSDSINLLTDETSKVMHGVTQIAGLVALGSGKVKSQADLVSKTSEDDRKSVGQMIEALTDATKATKQVAALAEQSNRNAEAATVATASALDAVNGTMKGMESIRETIAESEKRIKRLGERSQEITGIVNLINTISERTHVLALNASMQAAVAGEAGRGFAVVAEEVQRLAESSRNATQQIGTLVNNIQLETNETIATVNRTIGQVVQGSEQAQKAADQMRQTQEITAQLVAQVRRIAEGSEQQKEMSAHLLESVQNIGQSAERTAQQIDAQNVETESLLQSARRLVESVGVFTLPKLTQPA